jgi:hypothetical protein
MANSELPFFEEKSHQPLSKEAIDRMQEDDWQEFCADAVAAEEAMMGYSPQDEHAVKLVVARSCELGEKFGWEYYGNRSQVLGLAYSSESVANDENSDLIPFSTDSVAFHGVDIHHINGRWQAVLEFYISEQGGELPNGFYYVPPNKYHLMEFKVEPQGNDDPGEEAVSMITLLEQQVEAAGDFVMHGDFALMPPEAQRTVLQRITKDVDDTIPRERREQTVSIGCLKYYTSYDDMPGFDIRDFYTDQTDDTPEERHAITGFIEGFEYLELRDTPDNLQFKPAHFTFNAGAPCLILRDIEHGRTHYVLPQSVLDIV